MGILFRSSFESSHFAKRYPDKMSGLMLGNFWANKAACDDAERAYYEKLSGCKVSSLTEQIAAARKHIKNSLDSVDNLSSGLSAADEMALMKKLGALEVENKELKKVTDDLKSLVLSLQARVDKLDGGKAEAPAAKPAPAPAEEEDDDVDLFGSDDEEDHRGEAEGLSREKGQEAQGDRQDLRPLRCQALGRRDRHGCHAHTGQDH